MKSAHQANGGNEEERVQRNEPIIGFLAQAEAGLPVVEVCRKGGWRLQRRDVLRAALG